MKELSVEGWLQSGARKRGEGAMPVIDGAGHLRPVELEERCNRYLKGATDTAPTRRKDKPE